MVAAARKPCPTSDQIDQTLKYGPMVYLQTTDGLYTILDMYLCITRLKRLQYKLKILYTSHVKDTARGPHPPPQTVSIRPWIAICHKKTNHVFRAFRPHTIPLWKFLNAHTTCISNFKVSACLNKRERSFSNAIF